MKFSGKFSGRLDVGDSNFAVFVVFDARDERRIDVNSRHFDADGIRRDFNFESTFVAVSKDEMGVFVRNVEYDQTERVGVCRVDNVDVVVYNEFAEFADGDAESFGISL